MALLISIFFYFVSEELEQHDFSLESFEHDVFFLDFEQQLLSSEFFEQDFFFEQRPLRPP